MYNDAVTCNRDDILVMGYEENDEEANQDHDENLLRQLDLTLKQIYG